ncbi:MAG: DUF4974 domain-containing protein [Sphingobacteriales bacterium]|nr:DUF4974 domain-containing protein [Sphingobacteriales bacterium]
MKVLMPRQQAVIESGEISIKRNIDIENVMAWKNNVFYFENETLENILKELSRWYDVEIVYQNNGNIKNRKYFMIFNRDSKLSDVLKSLQISDIKFVIEGKKMIIK